MLRLGRREERHRLVGIQSGHPGNGRRAQRGHGRHLHFLHPDNHDTGRQGDGREAAVGLRRRRALSRVSTRSLGTKLGRSKRHENNITTKNRQKQLALFPLFALLRVELGYYSELELSTLLPFLIHLIRLTFGA